MQVPNSDKPISIYSLDMIISVGYRVNSRQGVAFRRWATRVLKEFMLKGYSINQHLISLQEHIDNRFYSLESRVDDHEQKIDFLIPVTEQLFSTGCYRSLILSSLIIADELCLLGASVKDMGRGLCTVIKLGFSSGEILKRI